MPETQKTDAERIACADDILTSHVEWFDALPGPRRDSIELIATNEPTGHYDVARNWRLTCRATFCSQPNQFRFEVSWQIMMLTNRDDRRTSAMVYKEPMVTKTSGLPEGSVPQLRYARAVLVLAEYLNAWKQGKFHELVSLINEPVRVHIINQYAQPVLANPIQPLYEERTNPW